jgi:hypothetical protein
MSCFNLRSSIVRSVYIVVKLTSGCFLRLSSDKSGSELCQMLATRVTSSVKDFWDVVTLGAFPTLVAHNRSIIRPI